MLSWRYILWWYKMRRDVKKISLIEHEMEKPEEDLQFLLWKAELNKELLSFWKSMGMNK
jgi:hypothetical protein